MKKYNVKELYKVRIGILIDDKLYRLKNKQQYYIALKEVDWLDNTYFYLVTKYNVDLLDDRLYVGEGEFMISESSPLAFEPTVNKDKLTLDEIKSLEKDLNSNFSPTQNSSIQQNLDDLPEL